MTTYRARSFALACACVTLAVAMVPDVARAQKESEETASSIAAAPASATSALRDSLIARTRALLGKKYRRGGETPKHGFDCSGLVAYVLTGLNLSVPRTAAAQAKVGTEIVMDTAQLLPGDLLTFGKGKKVTHIGIYIGNGRFIQASSKARKVIETNLLRAPAPGIRPWLGVRRVIALADSGGSSFLVPRASGATTAE